MAGSPERPLCVCRRRLLIQSGHQEWRFAKYHFDIEFAANDGSSRFKYSDPSQSR